MFDSNSLRSTVLRSTALRSIFFATGLLVFNLAVAAAVFKIDSAKSGITIVFKQLNVPIQAQFKKSAIQIVFDPTQPETSQASVEIDITSFDLGDPEYNKEVLKKEWFNAAQFPKAMFTSSSIKATGNGTFDVAGKLTIKGKTVNVNFPLTIRKEGTNQIFEGTLPIKRLAFNIGEGEWQDIGTVADEVLIKFRVTTLQEVGK